MTGTPASRVSGSIDPLLAKFNGRTDPPVRASDSPVSATAPLLAGLSEELAALYSKYSRRLIGLAAAVTFDRSVAEEVVHDAFLAFAPHRHEVRNPEAYLQRSVVNLGIRVVRRREHARLLPIRPSEPSTPPEIDEMWDLVGNLPPQQRAVVVLRFWEDQTQKQIAEVLDMPIGSVKSTLHRALRSLQASLQAERKGIE